MSEASDAVSEASDAVSDRRLILATLAGPLAWAAQLSLAYLLVATWCTSRAWLYLITILALAVTGWGLVVTVRARRADADADPEDAVVRRRRALATGGVMTAGFFAAVIVVQAITPLFLDPCLEEIR